MKKYLLIGLICLTIISFLLRVLPFGYGTAPIYFSDTPLFSRALELANGIANQDFSIFKESSFYPYFFSYVFLFVFGIFYLIGLIGGIFSSTSEFLRYVILEIEQLFEISRIVIGVFGALLVPLVYLIARKIILAGKKKWVGAGAFLSAVLMCFSLLHIHYSHLARPHVAVAFAFSLSFYFYLLLLEKKTPLLYILLAVVTGGTAGTIQNGLLAISFLIIAHFFIVFQQKKKKFFSFPFIASLLVFLLIVFVCWPYLAFNPGQALGLDGEKFDFTLSGQSHTPQGVLNGQGLIISLGGLIFSETSLSILLVFLLILYSVFKKKKKDKVLAEGYYRIGIIGGIFITIVHFLVFGMYSIPCYKFLVPIIPFFCIFAGILFASNLELVSKKYRFWMIVFVVIVTTFSIIQSVRLTTLIVRKDTRELAADWIEKNIDSSKMIAIASKGPKFFPNKESLNKKLLLAGPDSLGQRDNFLLSISEEEYPQNNRSIFPLWAFDEDYSKVYDFLKNESDYFVFVYYSQDPEITPLRSFEQKAATDLGELVKSFSPFRRLSNSNSLFPVHIENPIIDLWALDRMGPLVEIYKSR